MIRIGKPAPDFSCEAAVIDKISRVSLNNFSGKYKLLFFYPLDFTFVCPTELHALQDSLSHFAQRNVEILGISVDSVHSHLAWLQTPKNLGGIQGITFTLLSDIHKTVARDYGVLNEEAGVALRGVFLLDKDNIVQFATINNFALGRSIPELLRTIDALSHVEMFGEVCPANWTHGDVAMKATHDDLVKYWEKQNLNR